MSPYNRLVVVLHYNQPIFFMQLPERTIKIDFIVPHGWHELTDIRCPCVIL